MFGSKIRSWMENHIVRPRKKGNKNKNGSSSSNNSSLPTTNFNTQSGYLGPSYSLYNADSITGQGTMAVIGNGTNSVPSPARRHEVSPIQCHKTSRFGWHSPTHGNNKNLMSPKSEHYMKMQHQTDNFKTCINNSNNIMKSEQTIENNLRGRNQETNHNTMYNNNNSNINNIQQYNNSLTKTGDDRNHKMHHSSNVEMLKNKCFSNQQNFMDQEQRYQQQQQPQHQQHHHQHQHQHHHHQHQEHRNSIRNNKNQIESDEHNNKILSYKTSDKEHLRIRNKFENIDASINSSLECVHSMQLSEKKHFKRITEFEPNNSINHQNKSIFPNNNTDIKNHGKHHDNNSDNIPNTSTKSSSFAKTYKKIFSSSSSSASTNDRNGRNTPKINEGNYDQINANISPHYYQAIDNGYYGNNNNNHSVDSNTIKTTGTTGQKSTKEKMKKSERKQLTESGYYEMLCESGNFQQNSLNQHVTTSHQAATVHTSKSRNSVYEMNRVQPNAYLVMGSTNLHYRNNGRQNNTIGPNQSSQPNNNHPLAHVINSLSSPESAYSTGYSTDGTSPGTTYTPPEYYINMRTGTHYFPKNGNSLGIELSRQKFGLNKIEEVMSTHQHRRTESYDLNQIKITSHMELIDEHQFRSKESLHKQHLEHMQNFEKQNQNKNGTQQLNNSLSVNYRGFESPSPRQRSRIRTNPWYSTPESSFSASSSHLIKKSDLDTSSSSSGIKSNSDIRTSIVEDEKSKESSEVSDDETESSSTEVEVDLSKRMSSRGTLKQNDEIAIEISRPLSTEHVFNPMDFQNKNQVNRNRSFKGDNYSTNLLQQESDEDTTLNEMMGKFDESYIYEKETDILSNDSDPTHCNSDIDTGQDAGDEYDTEDLLDIDFIDTGSIQEIVEKSEKYKNTGNCSYHNFNTERRMSRNRRRSHRRNEEIVLNTSASGKRKKRLLKTRKKSCESKDRSASPLKSRRESRSVGGTPVCLRRRISSREKKNEVKLSPLVHQQRSNSLTFTEVHTVREKYIAIAESEKMLLKADLEADIKYKQLIHEAESILVSMKANAIIVPRETPVASPSRRILNPPANKRVEMLRQCEVDIKREMQKQQQQQQQHMIQTSETTSSSEHLINKRLEMLRHEYNSCNSVPTSPKCGRLSPRKTHLTNFINQVASSDIAWRNPNSNKNRSNEHLSSDEQQNVNIRSNRHMNRDLSSSPPPPPSSQPPPPPPPRRFLSEKTTHMYSTCSISNSEEDLKSMESVSYSIKSSSKKSMIDIEDEQNLRKIYQNDEQQQNQLLKESVANTSGNCNFPSSDFMTKSPLSNKQPLISFKSVDMGNKIIEMGGYCPQSEPLKRKIYKGSSSFERIKKSLDIESEIPKQNMLNKINSIRRDRQIHSNQSSTQDINSNFKNLKISNCNNNNNNNNNNEQNQQDQSAYQSNDEDSVSIVSNLSVKQQLILNTIEDLKKSLEDQCVELTAQFDT